MNIPNEETLFTALIDWVSYDLPAREASLPSLLALLKLPLMSPDVSSHFYLLIVSVKGLKSRTTS